MASLELDKILERAYFRTKERWVKAALTWILTLGLVIVLTLASILVAGAIVFIFLTVLKPLSVLGIILAILVFLGGVIWASSWASLAYAKVIASETPIGPFKALSEARSLVFSYMGFLVLYFFFMLGLLPYLAIPFILWSIWGVFYLYVFLAEPEARGGLKPLWRSRELVRGNVGKVLLIILLFLGLTLVGSMFSLAKSNTISMLWYLFSMVFIAPFSTSVYWEMYKEMAAQKGKTEATRPTASVVLSIVGLLIMVGLFVTMARGMSRSAREMNLKQFIQEVNRKEGMRKYPYKYNQKLPSTYDSSYDFYDGEF